MLKRPVACVLRIALCCTSIALPTYVDMGAVHKASDGVADSHACAVCRREGQVGRAGGGSRRAHPD